MTRLRRRVRDLVTRIGWRLVGDDARQADRQAAATTRRTNPLATPAVRDGLVAWATALEAAGNHDVAEAIRQGLGDG